MMNDPFRPMKKGVCKCCHGSGVQHNRITGLTQHCPCCHGSGKGKMEPIDFNKPIIYNTQ